MKNKVLYPTVLGLFVLLLMIQSCTHNKVDEQVVWIDPLNESPEQRDARMEWWREARFGLFIHWGVYSVPAGTYNGERIDGIGEWILRRAEIPVAEYKAYAQDFNPVILRSQSLGKDGQGCGNEIHRDYIQAS